MAIVVRETFTDDNAQIAASATAYVTTGATEKISIDKMLVHNTSGSSETITCHIDAAGDTPGAANIRFTYTLAANASRDIALGVNLTLDNSESLFLSTDTATTVNLHISGRRIVGN